MTKTEEARYTVESFVERDAVTLPQFASDGSVVYLSNATGHNQAYRKAAPALASPAQRLAETEGLVYAVVPRPDHAEALFIVDDGGNEQFRLEIVDFATLVTRELAGADNVVCNFGAWSSDGRLVSYASNQRDPRFFDVYVVDADTG